MLLLITYALLSSVLTIERCSNDGPQVSPEYYLVKKCHRSRLSISARANFTTLSNCKRFALEKKALSFNFSHRRDSRIKLIQYTCEVMSCAEISTGLSLINDSRYDYYSLFGNLSLTTNSSCVPSMGLFHFISKKKTYAEAVNICHNKSSVLADITSDDRTNALAQLLADVVSNEAYVSLKRNNGSDFITSNGDSLECTSYRAWAPGHPRKRGQDCVAITRHFTWRSISCDERLAVLCELIPRKKIVKTYFSIT